MFKVISNILFLPLIVIKDILVSERSFGSKICYFLLTIIFLGFIWFNGYSRIVFLTKSSLYESGIIDKLSEIDVRGESMMPTINNGEKIQLHSPKKYDLERGDIVSFKNIETGGLYYLKRIIGLPEEEVSLKNGFVTISGKILEENYVLNDLPTYGNTFITECNLYSVPTNHYLVLGDNRTVSLDSRVLGFISKDDIAGVIKNNLKYNFVSQQKQQKILKANIDANILLQNINQTRKANGSNPLMMTSLLNEIAQTRAKLIKESLDEWKNSDNSIEKLLQNKNYKYNLVHEFVTFGYLDEETITKQIFESPLDKTAFLSSNYMEIGVETAEKINQGCTFPVISIVISWPSIPTYSQELIDFWSREEKDSKEILNILQSFVNVPGYDQNELNQIIKSFAEISDIATQITRKIDNKEWLDYQQIDRYYQLIQEVQPQMDAFFKKIQASLPSFSLGQTPANQTSMSSQSSPQTLSSPNPTPINSKFISAGQKTIENAATATINSAWEEGDKVKIKITFANLSTNPVNLAPIRISMKSQTHGTSADPAIVTLSLEPGTVRSLEFNFEKLSNPPYKWVYLNSAGENVELGTYNP